MTDLFERLQGGLADRYRLERELGRGGMATVYLAHDLKHDRRVALKVLHPELGASVGPDRFQREIRTTARLQHPHILPVLDSGETAGQLWYTMPFVRGESLRDRLQRERQLPVDTAVDLATQVALALDYAHREGVVHRDLKPENILLSDGQALVADFGIAKAVSAAGEVQLTETGMAVGTPAYMSPEQAHGGQIDGRSDVYALGCVVYEMLTGEPPFTGSTPQALIAKRVLEPVPHVRTLRDTVSVPMEQALLQALAKTPADRFATAGEFARELSRPLTMPVSVTTAARSPSERALRRRLRVPAALAAIVLVGLGMLFAWRKSHRPDEAGGSGPTRLAVLPFENLGRPEDEYFADGVTDEVRGKLSALPKLKVVARTSSREYKKTTKHPAEIGKELGVQYLLTATVRWVKGGGGDRVRVSPELIEVRDASTKWQQSFDASVADVFTVQGQIAGQVAQALELVLGTPEREALAVPPTQNLAAYDAFARGEEAASSLTEIDALGLRRAQEYYEQAVALDSSFVRAWLQLTRVHALQYEIGHDPTPTRKEATRRAMERVIALAPAGYEAHWARAVYAGMLNDLSGAAAEIAAGLRLAPGNADLVSIAGEYEAAAGQWEASLTHLRQAMLLDPRSVSVADALARRLVDLRRYDEAVAVADRALAIQPTNWWSWFRTVVVRVAKGDLDEARRVQRSAPPPADTMVTMALAAFGFAWLLDDDRQRLVLRLPLAAFNDDRTSWGESLAEIYWLRGDTLRTRAYADSARVVQESLVRGDPTNSDQSQHLARMLALSGRKPEAVKEGERALALVLATKDHLLIPYIRHQLARTYLFVGEPEQALRQLELAVREPSYLTPGRLRIDPTFDPLRGNPRFERLVKEP